MNTIYNTVIPNSITSEYLDYLTNKVFALLPMFEESKQSKEKMASFLVYQNMIIQTVNGNTDLIQYNSPIVIDILSHLQALTKITSHADYKRHILKICNQIGELKKVVNSNV